MCDFHDFGLTFFSIMCIQVVARLPLHSAGPFGAAPFEIISKNVDFSLSKTLILAFEANSALPRENETKIVKITHSAFGAGSHAVG